MMELIILVVVSAFLGALLGILCGIIPALHQNNLAILLLLVFPVYGWAASIVCADNVFFGFIAMFMAAICTHNFSDILGTVLTGVPDSSELLTLQPAQRLMLKGEGQKIIYASLYGSVAGIVLGLLLLLPVKLLISEPVNLYEHARKLIPLVLLCVGALIVLSEKSVLERRGKKFVVLDAGDGRPDCDTLRHIHGLIVQMENDRRGKIRVGYRLIPFEAKKRLGVKPGETVTFHGIFVPDLRENRWKPASLALSVFLLSGFLGWTVLLTPLAATSSFTLLFPLFTGLFGVSGLLATIACPANLPEQKEKIGWNSGIVNRKVIGGAIAGMIIGIFPGITPGCGAVLIDTRKTKPEQYIALTSAIETSAFVFNIAALFMLQRTRSGAIATLEEFYGISTEWSDPAQIAPVLSLSLFAISLASLCALVIIPKFGIWLLRKAKFFVRKEFQIGVLVALVVSVFMVCGITGILVLSTATLVGLIPLLLNLRKIHLMGSIILPVAIVLLL
ncbi:MAG: tripartite tricarboxylate transporter permease [Thermoplasmata archaeon]|nr:tripartite tricarboxylate transporter permease [Thermoplasmata archaeon]